MGAGFSICHCNSSHATSPDKTTLNSLTQPDRVTGGAQSSPTGLDTFFTAANSVSRVPSSPKGCSPKHSRAYKPQKTVTGTLVACHPDERNGAARPSSTKVTAPPPPPKDSGISPAPAPDVSSNDSALVLNTNDESEKPKSDSSSCNEDIRGLPSQAPRPKSAAPSRRSRRSERLSKRKQPTYGDGTTSELQDLEHDAQTAMSPFRRFRPKSARDPRRRSNRVMDVHAPALSLSRSLSMPSKRVLRVKRSDGESSDLSDDLSENDDNNNSDSDEDEGEFSCSDTLSIPDETDTARGPTVTTIAVKPRLGQSALGKLGHQNARPPTDTNRLPDSGEVKGGIWERKSSSKTASSGQKDNNNNNRTQSNVMRIDSIISNADIDNLNLDGDSSSSNNNNSKTNVCTSSYHRGSHEDGGGSGGGSGFAKKASERSISGVILLTPCELPDSPPTPTISMFSTSYCPALVSKSAPAPAPPSTPHSPYPTPRTPAAIQLLSPITHISSPSSSDLDTTDLHLVNHTKSPSETPRSAHQRSPPATPCPFPQSTSPARPVTSQYSNPVCSDCLKVIAAANTTKSKTESSLEVCACGNYRAMMNKDMRANQQDILTDLEHKATRKREASCKTIASRPDSGIAGSSSASYASSETALLEGRHCGSQADLIASSLGMLEHVYQVRPESHPTVTSLVKALTVNCHSAQAKAHSLYRWLGGQSLVYYKCATCSNPSSPTSKMKQLAEGKTSYAAFYQEMARCAGLRCELIEGHTKGVHYSPGSPALCPATRHAWNAVSLNGHYALLDAHLGSLPYKFFLEHFFMTPPDEFCLSHYPKDKRWLLMTRAISEEDFFGALKTWPSMFAFNIRPLSMRSVIRTYDGRLSVTVLLHSVAVTPVLEYAGPGVALDPDALSLGIDQEIRNTDNAETFHMCLPQEGDYFFTLMVHDVEEDEDIPVFQYKIEYKDELL